MGTLMHDNRSADGVPRRPGRCRQKTLETLADLAVEPVILRRRSEVVLRVDAPRSAVVSQAGPPHVDVQRGRFPAPPRAEHAVQRVSERFPEVPVEVGVDQRVQRRVEVADPEN